MNLLIRKNIYWIIPLPLILNFFYNLVNSESYFNNLPINFFEIFSLTLGLILFLIIGKFISDIFKLNSYSLGIVYFLMSFFIFDNLLLIFLKEATYNFSFYLVLSLWTIAFLFKLEYKKITFLGAYYFFQQFINKLILDKLFLNLNTNGDVEAVWLPTTKNIYENNYFFSLIFSPEQGYGQLIPHIQASTYKLLYNFENYNYLLSASRIFFILTIVFLLELNIAKESKTFLVITYCILILNNTFWSYLFLDSLMAEAISSYLFLVLTLNITQKISDSNNVKSTSLTFLFFIYGYLYLSKQFFSTFVILVIFLILFKKRYRKEASFGLFCLLLNLFNYKFLLPTIRMDSHLSQIDIADTIFDLILFRNLNLNNIVLIIDNIYLDKPLTYVLVVFLSFAVYVVLKKKVNVEISLPMLIFSLLNIFLVLILYISAWRDMELESPVRFIVTFILFKLIFIFKEIEILKKTI